MEAGYYYTVEFKNSRLEVDDFSTVKAETESEARENFKDSDKYGEEVTITSVEEAFRIPRDEELLN